MIRLRVVDSRPALQASFASFVFPTAFALSLLLCCVAPVPAAITITRSSTSTTALSGYVTDTLTATTVPGEKIIGFDFVGGPGVGARGFFGPMHQVDLLGQPGVFNDLNSFYPFIGATPDQDSQFQVCSCEGITINPSESPTSLQAAFNYSAANTAALASNVWSFVHIAHIGEVSYVGTLTVQNSAGQFRLESISGILSAVPEPCTLSLIAVAVSGGVVAIGRKRGRKNDRTNMICNTSAPQLIRNRTAYSAAMKMLLVCFSVIACSFLTTSANGALLVSSFSAPTPSLPGYVTQTVTATAAAGEKIIGFDFVGGGGSYGIFGSMNQINPAGQPTVFQDNNPFFAFVGADVMQDSQFKVVSTKGIAISPSESSTSLKAAFNYNAASAITDASNVWSFLQIVHSATSVINMLGTMTVQNAQGVNRLESVNGGACLACYAPTIQDLTLNNVVANDPGSLSSVVNLVSPAPIGPFTWSNFTFDSFVPAGGASGTGPAIPAAFDTSMHKFTWKTVGSPLGTYKWLVNVANDWGSDQGSITVNITAVPEPATIMILALATPLLAGFRRR
jgi:hypothetical protein